MRALVSLVAVPLVSGCFSYIPLGTTTPARGADVVARLSFPLEVPLQDVTVRQVNLAVGRVTYADPDSLVLTAERLTSDVGADYPGLGAQLTIRRNQIADLRQRRVSAARTGLMLGVGAAAMVGIVTSVGPLLGSGSGTPQGPPQQP